MPDTSNAHHWQEEHLKYIFIVGIIILLLGCQSKQEENDINIINQIFPQLIKTMNLSVIKTIEFPPPTPEFISQDFSEKKSTFIKRSDIEGYISSLNKYHSYLQDCYNNYYRFDSINIVIGITDTLYAIKNFKNELATHEISKEYLGVLKNLNQLQLSNIAINIKDITNTRIFKIESTSKLGWYPKIDMKFWEKKRDYFLSGILVLSRIYLDKTKTHGILYCTKFGNEKEPLSKMIFIKYMDNKWKIDKTELQ